MSRTNNSIEPLLKNIMMAITHTALGVLTYAGAVVLTGGKPEASALGAAALGSLLPDIDTPNSRIGWVVWPLARWIEGRFGHRTITHSVVGVGLCAAVFAPALFFPNWRPLFIAILIGYAMHLLGDACTKSGVPLAWPRREQFVFPGNRDFRLRTGSGAEFVVLALLLAVGGAVLLPLSRYGPRRLLHMARGDLRGAVRDVQDNVGIAQCRVQVEGYNVLTRELVSGTFDVLGTRGDAGLIVRAPQGGAHYLLAESGDDAHRIEPRKAYVSVGKRIRTRSVTLKASNISLARIADAFADKADDAPEPNSMPEWTMNDIRLSGWADLHPFDPKEGKPTDHPAEGLPTVRFEQIGTRAHLDFASLSDLRATPVLVRRGVFTVTLPVEVAAPDLQNPLAREVLSINHLRRRADLSLGVGSRIYQGAIIARPFAQKLEPVITPAQLQSLAAAKTAARKLDELQIEVAALQGQSLWPELRAGYAARRAALEKSAAYAAPVAPIIAAPAPVKAPFSGVVEEIEWDVPTIPTLPGEVAEYAARVTILRVAL